jgi:hypothetical protein
VSRGAGSVQRWLLANLPPGDDVRQIDETAAARELARGFYGPKPTAGQVSSVRRALRGLEQRGLAERWERVGGIRRHGEHPGWTLAR